MCASCNDEYFLAESACRACTTACADGSFEDTACDPAGTDRNCEDCTAIANTSPDGVAYTCTAPDDTQLVASTCLAGYTLVEVINAADACTINVCQCPNGAVRETTANTTCTVADAEECLSCNAGFFLTDDATCLTCNPSTVANSADDVTCSDCLACGRVDSCDDGFHKINGTSTTADTCVTNVCSCGETGAEGTGTQGADCPNHGAAVCASCNDEYFLDESACPACTTACADGSFEYTACDPAGTNRICEDCTAVENSAEDSTQAALQCSGSADSTVAVCAEFFHLREEVRAANCDANVCNCANGAPAEPCPTHSATICSSCVNGYMLDASLDCVPEPCAAVDISAFFTVSGTCGVNSGGETQTVDCQPVDLPAAALPADGLAHGGTAVLECGTVLASGEVTDMYIGQLTVSCQFGDLVAPDANSCTYNNGCSADTDAHDCAASTICQHDPSVDDHSSHYCTCQALEDVAYYGDGLAAGNGCSACPADSTLTSAAETTSVTDCTCSVGWVSAASVAAAEADADATTSRGVQNTDDTCTPVACLVGSDGDGHGSDCTCSTGFFGQVTWDTDANSYTGGCTACTPIENMRDGATLSCSSDADSTIGNDGCASYFHEVHAEDGGADTCSPNSCQCSNGNPVESSACESHCPMSTCNTQQCYNCTASFYLHDASGETFCYGCAEVDNMADGTSLTCTTADDSQIGECTSGFYVDGSESYDSCIQCSAIENALDSATYTCNAAQASSFAVDSTNCNDGYFLLRGGDGGSGEDGGSEVEEVVADTCQQCTPINNTQEGTHITCTSDSDSSYQSGPECETGKTLPLPCVSTAFVSETLPFLAVPRSAFGASRRRDGPMPRKCVCLQQRWRLIWSRLPNAREPSMPNV